MIETRNWWVSAGFAVALALGTAACGDPSEEEVAPPEIAEVELEPAEIEPSEVDPAEIEFEAAFPLEAEDVGDVMIASGTVVGTPGPAGFFIEVEGNRVVFVESTQSVEAGERVSAIGPLAVVEVATFAGWEEDLLTDADPVWLVVREYFIDATSVQPLTDS